MWQLRSTSCLTRLAVLICFSFVAASAETVYTYTGKPFTIVESPYTTSDFVTATITTATPFAANLPIGNYFVDSLTMSDGQQSIAVSPTLPLFTIQIGTDSHGDIALWNLFLGNSAENFVSSQNADRIVGDIGSLTANQQADNDGTPGLWKITTVTPEPGSLGLFVATILTLYASLRIRRRSMPR